MPAGVCVVRTTARPAPAEGGGGLGEWVTSRGRRQAVWAAEPMNQLSGGGGEARGRRCRNAPRAARPGRAGGACACASPRPSLGGPGSPGSPSPRSLCLAPGFGSAARALLSAHGRAPCRDARELGLAGLHRLSTRCDCATHSRKGENQIKLALVDKVSFESVDELIHCSLNSVLCLVLVSLERNQRFGKAQNCTGKKEM